MIVVPVPAAPPAPAPAVAEQRASSSFWHAAWYRYRRNKLAMVSGVLTIIILLTGPWPLGSPRTARPTMTSSPPWPGPAGTICSGPTSSDGTR